jgi:hypothetical protein
MQGLFAGEGPCVQTDSLGCPAASEDFGERPAINVVAGRKMIIKSDVQRRLDVTSKRAKCREWPQTNGATNALLLTLTTGKLRPIWWRADS